MRLVTSDFEAMRSSYSTLPRSKDHMHRQPIRDTVAILVQLNSFVIGYRTSGILLMGKRSDIIREAEPLYQSGIGKSIRVAHEPKMALPDFSSFFHMVWGYSARVSLLNPCRRNTEVLCGPINRRVLNWLSQGDAHAFQDHRRDESTTHG